MAITRCPYCRAIIDEKDQFCTNCGTQLLFPEDEAVDEEIPGDRIVDAADEDKEYEIPPPGIVDDEEDEVPAVEDDLEEEVIIIDEIEEAVRRAASDDSDPSVAEEPPAEEPPIVRDDSGELPRDTALDKKTHGEEPSRPLTFDTGELEKSGRTAADLGNQKIDRWLESRQGQDQEKDRVMTDRRKKDDTLPPWAGRIHGDLSREKNEDDPVERPPIPEDSGIGLPESVTQAALPFGATPEPGTGEEISWKTGEDTEEPSDWELGRDEEAFEEREDIEEPEESEDLEESVGDDAARPPARAFRISEFLKSKAFDLFFMAVIWFVSTLLAARLMDTTVFRLLPAAVKALLGYFAVLVALYFFLFQFFLGETLGDRMFRRRSAD